MYSKEELRQNLIDMKFLPWDTVLIHSSMKSIGEVCGGAETVLDVLCEYFSDGLLIFPTHSWNAINSDHNIFDPQTEPSCVGILTNLFMKRQNVVRSLHPTHSVAAIGANAEEYISGEENSATPCPRNGCWGKLVDYKAKVLFIGCSLSRFTFIHGVEEWSDIPDRISDTPQALKIKMKNGEIIDRPMYRHKSSVHNVSDNYAKLREPLIAKGIAHTGFFGDAECIVADAKKTYEFVSELLQSTPDIFSNDLPVPEICFADKRSIKIAPSLLACDIANLNREVSSVHNADYIHIDVMDGHFVPNISFGVPIVSAIKEITEVPLDVHLMISNPSKYIKAFAEAGADIISVHYETDENLSNLISMIESFGVKPAVAIKPDTPSEVLFPFLERLYMVLVMTVEPGFGGQKMIEGCLDKIRVLRDEIRKRALFVEIEADGGITESNLSKISVAGVDVAVMGTAVFSRSDRAGYIEEVKK